MYNRIREKLQDNESSIGWAIAGLSALVPGVAAVGLNLYALGSPIVSAQQYEPTPEFRQSLNELPEFEEKWSFFENEDSAVNLETRLMLIPDAEKYDAGIDVDDTLVEKTDKLSSFYRSKYLDTEQTPEYGECYRQGSTFLLGLSAIPVTVLISYFSFNLGGMFLSEARWRWR